jgi:hypothetical protein
VRRADAEVRDPARPVRLVAALRDDHLRRSRAGGGRRGARAAVVHHGGAPAEQGLVVDLADDEAVVPVVGQAQVGPALADHGATALRADHLDGDPRGVLRGAHGHAAEARVHRWFARVQERFEPGRERPVVGHDPRAGLHDVEVGGLLPRIEHRVRRQPRAVADDEVEDAAHRRQAVGRALGVQRRLEQRVDVLGLQLPQRPVVRLRRQGQTRVRQPRRVVRCRQGELLERRVHVRDAQLFGHRPRPGRGRGQPGRHHRGTPRGRGDRAELGGDQLGRALGQALGRRWLRAGDQRPDGPADRNHFHADTGQPLRELVVRRRAHQHLGAVVPQLHRKRDQRLDPTPRVVPRQQNTHVHHSCLRSSVVDDLSRAKLPTA